MLFFQALMGPAINQACTDCCTRQAEGVSSGARKTAKIEGSLPSPGTSQFREGTRDTDKVNWDTFNTKQDFQSQHT